MIALRLDEAALAHSRGIGSRFGDVRVIDDDGRQVPYLVERALEPLSVDVMLERLDPAPSALRTRPSETVYAIAWPLERLSSARLVLTTNARVFRRRVSMFLAADVPSATPSVRARPSGILASPAARAASSIACCAG